MRVLEVTDKDFDKEVLNAKGKVVVLFTADWSGPARLIRAEFEDAAYDRRGKALFYKLDIENNSVTPAAWNIKGVPTVVVFENGAVILMKLGAPTSKEIMDQWLAEAGL
jgi:thioredoxin 1